MRLGSRWGRVTGLAPAPPPPGIATGIDAARAALTAGIIAAVPGEAGAISAALVTGDQGAIPLETAQAMRDSGLAHLLSIFGLHIAAVAVAAVVGTAYTLLAGGEVPTVRTILATLIVLLGMVIGREAFSLRLLAAAAFLILAVRPEALLGPEFPAELCRRHRHRRAVRVARGAPITFR